MVFISKVDQPIDNSHQPVICAWRQANKNCCEFRYRVKNTEWVAQTTTYGSMVVAILRSFHAGRPWKDLAEFTTNEILAQNEAEWSSALSLSVSCIYTVADTIYLCLPILRWSTKYCEGYTEFTFAYAHHVCTFWLSWHNSHFHLWSYVCINYNNHNQWCTIPWLTKFNCYN